MSCNEYATNGHCLVVATLVSVNPFARNLKRQLTSLLEVSKGAQ